MYPMVLSENILAHENLLNFKESQQGLSASVSVAPRVKQINKMCDQLVQCLEKIKVIESSEQLQVLILDLRKLVDLLPCGNRELVDLMASHNSAVNDFARDRHGDLLTEVLIKLGSSHQSKDKIPSEVASLIEITDSAEYILETMNVLSDQKLIQTSTHLIVQLLEKLLQDNSYLIFTFVRLSQVDLEERTVIKTDQFIKQLISFPDKVANKLESRFPRAFELKVFSATLMVNALKAFHVVCQINKLEQSKIYNTRFLSKLISKVFVHFKSDNAVLISSMRVISAFSEDRMYQESVRELMKGLERSAIELVVPLAFGDEDCSKQRLLCSFGDFWKSSSDWKFVLTKKLPLMSFSENDKIVENLSFFLATEEIKEMEILLMELLMIWGTKSHVNDTPFEQHFYVTKLVVLMTKYLQDPKQHTEKIRQLLFNGMQIHLGSSDKKLQVLGMITAEVILGIIDKDAKDEDKLKFEYSGFQPQIFKEVVEVVRNFADKNASSESFELFGGSDENEITRLMEKLVDSNNVFESRETEKLANLNLKELVEEKSEAKDVNPITVNPPTVELDSDDDDLQPYDDPDDFPIRKDHKRPRYLLDLIQAFTSKESLEDSEKFEFAVTSAEEIIKQQLSTHHSDIAIDLLRIYISLDKTCYMENFHALKMNTLIQICLIYPKECASFLCTEFNSETSKYAMSRRILMLDVLAETAKKLSKLEMEKKDDLEVSSAIVAPTKNKLLTKLNEELENRNRRDAQKIIRQRLIAKTRRIVTKTKSNDVDSGINRFSDVAGWFFFPLVHGFGRKQMVFKTGSQLKDEVDNLLLVKFLNTVAVMMLCAENSLIAPKMAKEIVNLSVFLRYHEEAQIRLAVLHMVATIILAVPRKVLIKEFQGEINEFVNHLGIIVKSSVINNEPDQECREFAKQLMGMFHETLFTEE